MLPRIPKVGRPPNPARVRFEISLDAETDKDIVRELDKHLNKSEYVRELIRKDMKRHSK